MGGFFGGGSGGFIGEERDERSVSMLRKGLFAKVILLYVLLHLTCFTVAVLVISYFGGIVPDSLIENNFQFWGWEILCLAIIKVADKLADKIIPGLIQFATIKKEGKKNGNVSDKAG